MLLAKRKLSIIIPAHNEEGNLTPLVGRIVEILRGSSLPFEILIVNDHSMDCTSREALDLAESYPEVNAMDNDGPKGMGNALKKGISRSTGDVVAFVMADGVDPIENLPSMLLTLEEKHLDVLISSRYARRQDFSGISLGYIFWSRTYYLLARALLHLKIKDPTNAFRLVDRTLLDRLRPRQGDFSFSAEITFMAHTRGFRVGETPGSHGARVRGKSSFKFTRVGPSYALVLLKAFLDSPAFKKSVS